MQDSSIIEISLLHYPEPYGALFAAKGSHVKMPYFQERIVATLAGCITSIQAIYVPADDLTDPAPVVIFGHLDGITVLSRASKFPAGVKFHKV